MYGLTLLVNARKREQARQVAFIEAGLVRLKKGRKGATHLLAALSEQVARPTTLPSSRPSGRAFDQGQRTPGAVAGAKAASSAGGSTRYRERLDAAAVSAPPSWDGIRADLVTKRPGPASSPCALPVARLERYSLTEIKIDRLRNRVYPAAGERGPNGKGGSRKSTHCGGGASALESWVGAGSPRRKRRRTARRTAMKSSSPPSGGRKISKPPRSRLP